MPVPDDLPPPADDNEPGVSSGTTVWTLGPAITRDDIPRLCEQLLLVLRDSAAAVVICDVGAVAHPDAVTIEAVARLQLTARRLGRHIRLHRVGGRLAELLSLTGLSDVVSPHDGLRLEPRRQPEQREQGLGVQEGVHPDDPSG